MINKGIYFFIFGGLLGMTLSFSGACTSEVPNSDLFHNEELRNAAEQEETFYEHSYGVISLKEVLYFENPENETDPSGQLKRGDIVELMDYQTRGNNQQIRLPGDSKNYFVKNSAFFRQHKGGMRFPVIGMVKNDNEYLEYFDEEVKGLKKLPLFKGQPYFYLISKDKHIINVWDEKSGMPRTGTYSKRKLEIVQAEDHIKIMSKHKTHFTKIFKEEL